MSSSKPLIHPAAIVDPSAKLGKKVSVGAYSIIGPHVVLEDEVEIKSHVVIEGRTHIGKQTIVYPFCSIGAIPQDLKYKGEESVVEIGSHNVIREYVTIHPGTEGGGMITKVGNHCLLMIGVHVAHDCVVGDNVILANNATLAGHVTVGDFAIIGGLSAVKQFVRIGHHAMIGGMSGIESDVIPYGQATGDRATLSGLNLVGLRRRGFERDQIHTLRSAYRLLFSPEGTLSERLVDVQERFKDNPIVMEMVAFIRNDTSKALCQPKHLDKE